MNVSPHEILGVPPGASPDEVRQAYRTLALRLHPDRNPGDAQAAEQFLRVSRAYEAIRKDDGLPPFEWTPRSSEPKTALDAVTHIVETVLGELMGRRAPPAPKPRTQETLDIRIDLPLSSSLRPGQVVDVELPAFEPCSTCGGKRGLERMDKDCRMCSGTGKTNVKILEIVNVATICLSCMGSGKAPCDACQGSGRSKGTRRVSLIIPQGIRPGVRLRFAKLGDIDPATGKQGDLLCDIRSSK